ncbi:MAG: hypothetical protein O2807_01765 [bacterium]|nr:hypothetical protein [bacterium]
MMNSIPKTRSLNGKLIALAAALFMASGCAFSETKSLVVEIRVPPVRPAAAPRPIRARFVLVAKDAVSERNLSRTGEYALSGKGALTSAILPAAAGRMQAAGIEPLESGETARADGMVVITIRELEVELKGGFWNGTAILVAERYNRAGRLNGKWEAAGKGSHQDSRVLAGAAGLAMGKALDSALKVIPWETIARGGR